MIRYDFPKLNVDPEVTFKAIPDEIFEETMNELDKILARKMRKNEIQENMSMEYAAKFVTTI
ncbi:MAG: hypothetical protein K6G83_06925 [Lachnospiraceae bacterium]|nr:hypothetical protein [Lachnospiraceae bacterium]